VQRYEEGTFSKTRICRKTGDLRPESERSKRHRSQEPEKRGGDQRGLHQRALDHEGCEAWDAVLSLRKAGSTSSSSASFPESREADNDARDDTEADPPGEGGCTARRGAVRGAPCAMEYPPPTIAAA
jgi:hypothetical protein